MVGTTRQRIGAFAAMGLVVTGVVGSSLTASGQTTNLPDAPPAQSNGTLTIVLNANRTGYVELKLDEDLSGSKTIVQRIATTDPCAKLALDPLPGGDLLTITPFITPTSTGAIDSVQIPGEFLGVHRGTNCGGPAGQIGFNEQLTIALGPGLAAAKATSASLRIRKTNRDDGNLQWKLNTVPSDTTTAWTLAAPVPGVGTTTVSVPGPVLNGIQSITLGSTATSNSRGLSVASGTSFRLTNLVLPNQFDVNCGEEIGRTSLGGIATSVLYVRGANAVNPDKSTVDCQRVEATVRIGDDSVFADNSELDANGDRQLVQSTFVIDWAPTPASSAGLPTLIDYDGPGTGGFTDVLWCTSFTSTNQTTFTGVLPLPRASDLTVIGENGLNGDGTVPWCLVSSSESLNGGLASRTEKYFGSGDPDWGRR